MGRLTEKIVIGLLGLFLLVTVGYQVYTAIYGSMKTETVFEYTVSRAIPVDGVAIRPEVVIEGEYNGIESYIFEDGERVTIGENVAEFYESHYSDRNLRRLRELEAEMGMLKDAQDSTVNNFAATEMLNRDIKEQLGYLTGISDRGRFANSGKIRESLSSLINKKQIATGMAEDFEPRLRALQDEFDSLEVEETDSSVIYVKAPLSGYFSKTIDGYEDILTPENVKDYGIADYLALFDGEAPDLVPRGVGKIIKNQNWIFAASAQKTSLEFVRPNQEVYLSFELSGKKIPATVTDIMQEKDDDRAVILLACNQVSGTLIEMRKESAVINFNQYTGLRVNMSDIRFQGEKRGVYVAEGNVVRFKLIDPIYEEQSFVLSRLIPPDTQGNEYVSLFDQIITKGNDLYDGKAIQ